MDRKSFAPRNGRALVGTLLVSALVVAYVAGEAVGDGTPADKVSAAGSTTQVIGPGQKVTLLSETMRASAPSDLILQVTAECALVTNVTTVGNDTSEAVGQVQVWVEIDGVAVPTATGDPTGGRIVFCNRAYKRTTTLFDDEDATIQTFFRSRQANAFNWAALDVGAGIHTITVKATLTTQATPNAHAEAVVGNRTLVVEPTKFANGETV